MSVESVDKVQALKKYFSKRPDILFAFLFGSHAKKNASRISDWDIAVYFRPERHNEIEAQETQRYYSQESEVWTDLMDILRSDNVDLVVLNRAPADIAAAAVRATSLDIKDRRTYLEFMLMVTQEAEDFRKTVQEYADVYWRSSSLSEEDKDVATKRLVFLDSELNDVPRFQGLTKHIYENDRSKRREVERWIENLVNATIDISKIILASQKKTIPPTYREVLEGIDFLDSFFGDLGKQLSKFTELRNILAHEYLDIRWKRIEEFIKEGPDIISKFVKTVREFVK